MRIKVGSIVSYAFVLVALLVGTGGCMVTGGGYGYYYESPVYYYGPTVPYYPRYYYRPGYCR